MLVTCGIMLPEGKPKSNPRTQKTWRSIITIARALIRNLVPVHLTQQYEMRVRLAIRADTRIGTADRKVD